MDVKGFIGISLVDWDGKNSSVMFLPNCNFRCPFCYNTKLVLHPDQLPTVSFERILKYLRKNTRWIDGVVITGGEPTLHEDLPVLCKEIKKLGYLLKLDTNGTNPALIRRLANDSLVNYVAMDVKAPFTEEKYARAAGVSTATMATLLPKIDESIQILLEGKVDYEFRTTLVPTIHKTVDIEAICHKIKNCKKYSLQNFRANVETINPSFEKLTAFLNEEVNDFFQIAKKLISNTVLRA
jgi:pyruvate formate lyase activating enzyme